MKLVYSEIFDSAWKTIKDDLALVAGLTLVVGFGIYVFSHIPFVGSIFTMPLSAGYLRCLLQIRRKEVIGYQDVFWGFLDLNRLLHLVIINLLVWIGTVVGIVLLVVPGIWWVVASTFSLQIFVMKNTDAIESIKTSMALVKGRWWNVFGLLICCGLVALAGVLCFLVGALIAFPVATLALFIAAEKLSADPTLINPSPLTSSGGETPVETTTIAPQ